ncbi:rhodanese homology domain-containing protein [Enterobacteriaceae bacterium H18W14]|uniref:rhodanese homology domain-containing protein n=1 Tax=Dryocola boscaweniae TaxID=2925397 RepID=UPI0022F0F487|nr:rhodanese homology domain-containing protein [Dryocola boscaweniae]MCT4717149.1 rhodanese homology domain-containing protein [Dryocola boscaweniae]
MSELRHYAQLRATLAAKEELALIDVREEAPFASGHPLFAANIPLGKLELEVYARIPRRTTPITVYDNGEGLAINAVEKLKQLGYRDVALLAGGLQGWQEAGGEIFIDVNAPSKAFGELVEAKRHTPSLSAEEVQKLQRQGTELVVLDVRRFDEYQTMNIPGSISLPGGDLVLKARAQVSGPQTQIVVNCAGRTRSIIGAQSLINAGISNPVVALRNGTIGWTLAGQALEQGQERQAQESSGEEAERIAAWELATSAGVSFVAWSDWQVWRHNSDRNTWLFDVRSPEEYRAGHLPGARSVPGGQLVQETDHYAAVRGGRIVLVDDDGVRAPMAASWLAQMGWEVAVLEASRELFTDRGDWQAPVPAAPKVEEISPATLAAWLEQPGTTLLDFTTSANFRARHIPGAKWLGRAQLKAAVATLPEPDRWVVTCGSSALARFAAPELQALSGRPVYVLQGGTLAWIAENRPLAQGVEGELHRPEDRYRRPYEGTNVPRKAMEDYLQWEYGLVAQLERDGTHGFWVI